MGNRRKYADLGEQAEAQAKLTVDNKLSVGMARNEVVHLTPYSTGKALCNPDINVTQMSDYYTLSVNGCVPCDREYARMVEAEIKQSARNHWSKPAAQEGYVPLALFPEEA